MNENYKNHAAPRREDSFISLIAGIAIGIAATMLTQQKNRDRLKRTWKDVQSRGADLLDETSKKAEDLTKTARQKTKKLAERAKNEIEKVEDMFDGGRE